MTVGPIIFSDETARRQLQEHGVVVTFRASQRTTGPTWWRESRLGEKKGDVVVEEIGSVNQTTVGLKDYAHLSGFETVEDWIEAINELNGYVGEGWLYRVSLDN